MSTALIVVGVRNDFCEGGFLAVPGGAAVVAAISRHVAGRLGVDGVDPGLRRLLAPALRCGPQGWC